MTNDRKQSPPVAKTVPHELEAHGDVRVDPYYWLNDRENPEVIAKVRPLTRSRYRS